MRIGLIGIFLMASVAWTRLQGSVPVGGEQAGTDPESNSSPAATADFDAVTQRAAVAREAGRLKEALGLYRELLELRPSWIEGWWYLGTLQYETLNFGEAVKVFERLTSLQPDQGPGWAMRGLCEFELRRYEPSLQSLEKGLQLGLPPDEQVTKVAHFHAALLLNRFGRFEEASRILTALIKETERHSSRIEALGISRLSLPVLPSEVPPQRRELVLKMGDAAYYTALGRLEDARREYQGLVSRYHNESRVRHHYGAFLLLETGETGAAILELEQAARLAPQDPESRRLLARAYAKAGRREEAEREQAEFSRLVQTRQETEKQKNP